MDKLIVYLNNLERYLEFIENRQVKISAKKAAKKLRDEIELLKR